MKQKDMATVGVILLVVLILGYSFAYTFVKENPYLGVLLGVVAVVIISVLVYFSIKSEKLREKERNVFSFMLEAIKAYFAQMGKERKIKERKPLPKDTKNKVYDLAGDKCQICGKRGNLKIHHIDGDPSNHILTNLILLCGNHHDDADKGVIPKWRLEDARKKQKTTGYISVSKRKR